jgi:hypothetical protein
MMLEEKMRNRETHYKLIYMMDEGLIDPLDVANAALAWMEDREIADMCRLNEFILEDENEEFLVDEE